MSLSGEEPTVSRARAALTVVVGLAVAGAVVGALWTWLAPPIHGVVALTRSGDRIKAALGSESDHWFTSAFLIVGMLAALAVVAAVLVWQWRGHRGPVMVTALAVGGVAAGAVAAVVGALGVRLRYGTIDLAAAPVSEQHRVHLRRGSARRVLRPLAAADRRDGAVPRGGRGTGLPAARHGDCAGRSRGLAADRVPGAAYWSNWDYWSN